MPRTYTVIGAKNTSMKKDHIVESITEETRKTQED